MAVTSEQAARVVRIGAAQATLLMCAVVGCSETVVLGSDCPEQLGRCLKEDATRAPSDDRDAEVDEDDGATLPACDPADDPGCACGTEALGPPLAHWPLDESAGATAADRTGHAPAGTLQNFAVESAWQAGKIGGGLLFDGLDDAVAVGAVEGGLKTLSLWIKPDSASVVSGRTSVQPPSSHGPLNQWLDPENAYADDGVPATTGSLIGSSQQHWGGFHLAEQLPRDARILGITVTVDTGNLGVLGGFVVELSSDGGETHTDSRYGWGQLLIGSNQRQAGGPDKLWGRAWSAGDFTSSRFRVRGSFGGIANAMSLDFLGVQVTYAEQATPRTILSLTPDAVVEFAGEDGKSVATSGWQDSTVYVNGSADGALQEGWNHLAVVSDAAIAPSGVLLGKRGAAEQLSYSYQGQLDDVLMFDAALTPDQVAALHELVCRP